MPGIKWDQLALEFYGLLQPSEKSTDHYIELKYTQYAQRHKIILKHDNARPNIAHTLKTPANVEMGISPLPAV